MYAVRSQTPPQDSPRTLHAFLYNWSRSLITAWRWPTYRAETCHCYNILLVIIEANIVVFDCKYIHQAPYYCTKHNGDDVHQQYISQVSDICQPVQPCSYKKAQCKKIVNIGNVPHGEKTPWKYLLLLYWKLGLVLCVGKSQNSTISGIQNNPTVLYAVLSHCRGKAKQVLFLE